MYHGVDGTINKVRDLENQFIYLRQHFDIVPMAYLATGSASANGKTPVAITFDDGLKNNYVNVAPLLVKHAIPATFFVCPGLIDDGAWLWNHEARLRLMTLADGDLRSLFARYGIAGDSVEDVIDWMKTQPIEHRKRVESDIRGISSAFTPSQAQHELCDIMSWNDVAALPDLVTVGSHTNSHPVLTTLGSADLIAEIADSKKRLETRLNRPVDYFCYPNGAVDAGVVSEVRKHYKAAVTVDVGYVDALDDRYLLKRIPASPNMGISSFAWQLHRAGS